MRYYSKNFYKRRNYPEEKWMYSKQNRQYVDHLMDLAITLKMLYPDQEVRNPYQRLEAKAMNNLPIQKKEYVMLYRLLVQGLTKLNHPYRERYQDEIESTREDVLLPLRLLQPILWPITLISRQSKWIYRQLIKEFYPHDFTIRQSIEKLRIPKSNLQRHFTILEKCDYIERTGGNKKVGYRYNLGSRK